MSKLQGKTIVVTGVSSGIGSDTAKLLRQQGARVIGLDRNDPMLTLDGFVKADLSEQSGVDAALTQLPAQVDGLANIAGVPGTASVDLVARVNYLALRHLTLKLADRMPAGGSVVNVASILGAEWPARLEVHKALAETSSFEAGLVWLARNPVPHATCYQYFKEALIVWTMAQSQKLFLAKGVRMNSVAPGPVFTPILGDFDLAFRLSADEERLYGLHGYMFPSLRPVGELLLLPQAATTEAAEHRWLGQLVSTVRYDASGRA